MTTWQTPPTDPPPFEPPAPRVPRGFTVLAWIVIVLGTVVAVGMRYVGPAPGSDGKDPIGLVMMKMQAQYMVGATEFQGGGSMLYPYAQDLNAGSIDQRQRFMPVAAELAGAGEAASQLAGLDELIARRTAAGDLELTEAQIAIQEILHRLYPDREAEDPDLDALDDAQRALLVDELGWFGELALAPPGTDSPERVAALAAATRVFFVMLSTVVVMAIIAGVGFVGLVILGVLAIVGRIPSGMGHGLVPHGLYAETFALWMVLFFGLQIAAGLAALAVPDYAMILAAAGFFASMVALAWPVLRGATWSAVRQDIGWTAGRQPYLEPIIGVAGYVMGLPILGIGVLLTLVLIFVQGAFAGVPDELAPTGGPAHPIILDVASGSIAARLQILLVASVAAPIVEETMFRGVLYRHLRDASRGLGIGLSIVFSTLLNAFIFAIIHPQGWIAVPALMSLAIAFTLAREWRGTVLPSILMHAISNGLVMTMLFSLLSV